jgi:uncharacterized membrane-anchored protein
MYQRKPQVIWIDGASFTLGVVTLVCAIMAFAMLRGFGLNGVGIALLIGACTFTLLALLFFWFSWRVGRKRKANYDARPNKVLPRAATSNADMDY